MSTPPTPEDHIHIVREEKIEAAKDTFGTLNAIHKNTQDSTLHLRVLYWQLKNTDAAIDFWQGVQHEKVHMGLPRYDSTGTVLVSADLAGWLPHIPHFRALGIIAAPDCHSYLCKGWPTLVHGPAEEEFPALVRQFLRNIRAEGQGGKYSLSAMLFSAGYLFWNPSYPIGVGSPAWKHIEQRLQMAKQRTQDTIDSLER